MCVKVNANASVSPQVRGDKSLTRLRLQTKDAFMIQQFVAIDILGHQRLQSVAMIINVYYWCTFDYKRSHQVLCVTSSEEFHMAGVEKSQGIGEDLFSNCN